MSYILDALKKSEQERELGRVPTINTVHHILPVKGKSAWPWIAGVALIVNGVIGGIFYWYLSKPAPTIASEKTTVNAEAQMELAIPLTQAETEPQPDLTLNTTAPIPFLTWPDGREDTLPQNDYTLDDTAASVNAEDAPVQEVIAEVEAVVEPVETQSISSEVPLFSEMDHQFRASLPPLSIDVHVFSEKQAERFVFVNMVKRREGETVKGEIVLRDITPEGVVLRYRGQEFRLLRP